MGGIKCNWCMESQGGQTPGVLQLDISRIPLTCLSVEISVEYQAGKRKRVSLHAISVSAFTSVGSAQRRLHDLS